MPRSLFVSYNPITGIPSGHHVNGNAVAYSCEIYPYRHLLLPGVRWASSLSKSERVAREAFTADAQSADVVYLYIGLDQEEGAVSLLQDLQSLKKKIHIVACECSSRATALALRFSTDIIRAECKGRETMARLLSECA